MKKRYWLVFLLGGISFYILSSYFMWNWYEQNIQKEIAEKILRFHVLANSDSEEDQEEKMQVKSVVADYLRPILQNATSKENAMECVKKELYNIEETAQNMVESKSVTVSLEKEYFPQIKYGDCTFPAGIYDTLQIEIGEAMGKNWWCVLYPGLCFSSAIEPVVTSEDKELLKHTLDEKCYHFLLRPAKMKIRFRLFGLELFSQNR